jgi:sulfur carrier protein ThiS
MPAKSGYTMADGWYELTLGLAALGYSMTLAVEESLVPAQYRSESDVTLRIVRRGMVSRLRTVHQAWQSGVRVYLLPAHHTTLARVLRMLGAVVELVAVSDTGIVVPATPHLTQICITRDYVPASSGVFQILPKSKIPETSTPEVTFLVDGESPELRRVLRVWQRLVSIGVTQGAMLLVRQGKRRLTYLPTGARELSPTEWQGLDTRGSVLLLSPYLDIRVQHDLLQVSPRCILLGTGGIPSFGRGVRYPYIPVLQGEEELYYGLQRCITWSQERTDLAKAKQSWELQQYHPSKSVKYLHQKIRSQITVTQLLRFIPSSL